MSLPGLPGEEETSADDIMTSAEVIQYYLVKR